ncbi:hypothetical protein IAU60_001295 [Kwoniella sp. DSM 27419]
MALQPSQAFLRQGKGSHSLEVYVDILCPFSKKIIQAINSDVLPLIRPGGKYAGQLELIVRLYPQPFHYFAMFPTEALVVFGQLHPDLFWDYLLAVYSVREEYLNKPAVDMTPSTARDKLVHLALDLLEKKGKTSGPLSKAFGEFRGRLDQDDVSAAIKYNIKVGRQNGVHVTPTVLLNGLKEDSVSSSWGKSEWEQFLSDKLGA